MKSFNEFYKEKLNEGNSYDKPDYQETNDKGCSKLIEDYMKADEKGDSAKKQNIKNKISNLGADCERKLNKAILDKKKEKSSSKQYPPPAKKKSPYDK